MESVPELYMRLDLSCYMVITVRVILILWGSQRSHGCCYKRTALYLLGLSERIIQELSHPIGGKPGHRRSDQRRPHICGRGSYGRRRQQARTHEYRMQERHACDGKLVCPCYVGRPSARKVVGIRWPVIAHLRR